MKNSKKGTLLREAGWVKIRDIWHPPTYHTEVHPVGYALKTAWKVYMQSKRHG